MSSVGPCLWTVSSFREAALIETGYQMSAGGSTVRYEALVGQLFQMV